MEARNKTPKENHMTIAELIQALSRFDGSLRVVIPGYEAGATDLEPTNIEQVLVCLDAYNDEASAWSGPHHLPSSAELAGPPSPTSMRWSNYEELRVGWRETAPREQAVLLGVARQRER